MSTLNETGENVEAIPEEEVLAIRVPVDMKRALERLAVKDDRSLSSFMRLMLRDFINRKPPKQG